MFGKRGDWSFDAQEKYINLRYSLLPYIYSSGYDITKNAGTMMRALSMDFAQDKKVHNIDDQFMFGKSILVAPVTDSMYVDRMDGKAVENFDIIKTRTVYLPDGTDWYDFWTGERLKGRQQIEKAAPIDIIPLYVKAGTILPWGPKVQYAEEKKWDDLSLFIYPGADGEFVLYEDENNNYNYEKGICSTIQIRWNDDSQTLSFSARQGEFPGMLEERNFKIVLLEDGKSVYTSINRPDKEIRYKGEAINVKM